MSEFHTSDRIKEIVELKRGGIRMTFKKIAFIGTGVMGSSIVRHLLKADYEVTIYTRTKDRATALISEGAKWSATAGEAASGADIIITMVGYPYRCGSRILWIIGYIRDRNVVDKSSSI